MQLEYLVRVSKHLMLKCGDHPPMLYIEPSVGEGIVCVFDDLPATTQEKQLMMFRVGKNQGKAHPGMHLNHIYFVVEAWYTILVNGEISGSVSGKNPQKEEHLIILHRDVAKKESEITSFQIIRQMDIVDLLQIKREEKGEVIDELLPSFLDGFVRGCKRERTHT